MNRFINIVSATLAMGIFSNMPLFAQETQTSPIIGVLRLSSINELKSAVSGFSENILPGSGAGAEQFSLMATQLGLDVGEEILALLVNPTLSSQPYAFVLPVSDPSATKQNPAFAFQAASKPDVFKMTLPGTKQEMFASFEGKKLILAPMEPNIEVLKPLIKNDTIAASIAPLRSGGGQLALSLSFEQLYIAYKPMLDIMMMGLRTQTQQAAAGEQADPAALMSFAESTLNTLGEIKGFGLRLNIEKNSVNLSAVLQPKPGTALSKLMNLGKASSAPSLAAFNPNSAFFATGSMKVSPDFVKAYNDMVKYSLSSSGDPKAQKASEVLIEQMNEFFAIWDGTASMAGMAPGEKVITFCTYGITDASRALKMVKDLNALQTIISGFVSSIGTEAQQNFSIENETVEGPVTFIDIKVNTKSATPKNESALKSLSEVGLGETMTTTFAISPQQIVYGTGQDPRAGVKKFLAASNSGTTISPKDYGFPDTPNIFFALSIPRMVTWLASTGVLPNPPENPSAKSEKPGLGIMVNSDGNSLSFQLLITAEEVKSLMQLSKANGGSPDSE